MQNEFAPEKFLNRYEKRFEKREKGSEKRSETRLKKILAPLRPTKNFSPPIFHQILKVFHRPKFAQKKSFFFTARLCREGHANKWGCNKWGFKGCLTALPGNRPRSAFFALFLPFSPFSGGCKEHLGNPEKRKKEASFPRYPQIYCGVQK